MRQSTAIFGTLILAFVIYITLRGQLPRYLSLFTGANVGGTNTGSNSKGGKASDGLGSVLDYGQHILDNLGGLGKFF